MVIFNNMAAMSALNETNRNTGKLGKIVKQAASGMRINSAGDDASGYSISERMRVKIRALGQCKENSAKGQDLIDTASAAINEQVNIMKQVKTIALRATDSTYTDADRGNLQKELSQLLDQSEEIAHTEFNSIHLLDQKSVSSVTPWFDADAPYRPNPNNEPVLAQAARSNYRVPNGGYVDITPSTVLYDPSSPQKGAAMTSLPAVGSYVWDDAAGAPAKVFQDPVDNSLHLGSITGTLITVNGQSNPSSAAPATATNISQVSLPQITGTPAVGSKVSPLSSYMGPNSGYDVVNNPFSGAVSYWSTSGSDTGIGTNSSYNSITELDLSALSAAVTNVPQDLDGLGFSFDCSGCAQFVTVMFDANASDAKLYEGESRNPHPLCYVIGVKNVSTTPSLEASLGEVVFNGVNAVTQGTTGNSLPSAVDTSTELAAHHNIKLNYHAATGKISITKNGPNITLMIGCMGQMKEMLGYKPEQNFYLQTDDKSSQNTKLSVPNTTLAILFPAADAGWDIDPSDEDYPAEWPKGYDGLSDAEKKAKWKEEVWQYPDRKVNLDVATCVSTREKANTFLDDVDQAIKYLLNANTTLGAQSSRLDYTQENIVVMQENTTSAESVQRDADMAKVAMEQAKYNLLQQASQSMLAQANQTPNGVLSLLQ